MIRNIIFDLGKVIINYNQKQIINNFTKKEEEIKYIYDEIFHAPEWELMDIGDITNEEAIDVINDSEQGSKIKAILLDLNMPNVDGFEVLDYFKSNDLFKKYPTSIITGVDDKESIEKAYKYPIVDILLKPFNERDVKKILEKTINNNI